MYRNRFIVIMCAVLLIAGLPVGRALSAPLSGGGGPISANFSAGAYHTCWLKDDGTLACWGRNDYGQSTPPDGVLFIQVSAGYLHTCGLKSDFTPVCWGAGTTNTGIEPEFGQSIPPAGEFIQVGAGTFHTCGMRSDFTLACWGDASQGQFDNIPPVETTFAHISVGAMHACGLKSDNTLACWGENSFGQSTPPDGIFAQVSAGAAHTCGLRDDGTIACWGAGTTDTGIMPNNGQSISPAGTFQRVSAGALHTCGLTSDGALTCWGAGTTNTGVEPDFGQSMPPAGSFTQVSAGTFHTCALQNDDAAVCWGSNAFGQLASAMTFHSVAAQDGWILESRQYRRNGNSLNTTAETLRLGDDAANRQYRAILSFKTNDLPDNAIIQSALVKIKQSTAPTGSNPFDVLGNLWVDIRKGSFGRTAALALEDFNARASAEQVGAFNVTFVENWYAADLDAAGRSNINKTGLTQLRLRFATDDNNNHTADFIKFLSGDSATGKPELVITYSLP